MADMWVTITESESVINHYTNIETKLEYLRNCFASTVAPASTNLVSGMVYFCTNSGSIAHYGYNGSTWANLYSPS